MQHTIAVVGLGYVWLPLAYHFAKAGYSVIGFEISQKKLTELRAGIDMTHEVGEKIRDVKIHYTDNPEDMKRATFIIVAVPTPVNENRDPDYTPLIKSSETIGKVLQKWQIVVYESTVDPGATEEVCLPILEKQSGLKLGQDFKLWYSPERINPGDKEHTVDKIVKVVSGSDAEALETIAAIYSSVVTVWVHRASSIKVAEAAKIIENTQRDINIAFMNELAKICDKLGINTYDVLAAAGTKWNFLKFTPGLVGGHCIGVDPYYLAKRAIKLGMQPEVILAGRRINDDMPIWVANQIIKLLIKSGKKVEWARILVLGLTFKENVPDFRNSKIAETIKELRDFWVQITGYDPYLSYATGHDFHELHMTKEDFIETLGGRYDGVIFAQNHREFADINLSEFLEPDGVVFDLKGRFRETGFAHYKSL